MECEKKTKNNPESLLWNVAISKSERNFTKACKGIFKNLNIQALIQ